MDIDGLSEAMDVLRGCGLTAARPSVLWTDGLVVLRLISVDFGPVLFKTLRISYKGHIM